MNKKSRREQKKETQFPLFTEGLAGLSLKTVANYIKTHKPSGGVDTAGRRDKICYVHMRQSRKRTSESESVGSENCEPTILQPKCWTPKL